MAEKTRLGNWSESDILSVFTRASCQYCKCGKVPTQPNIFTCYDSKKRTDSKRSEMRINTCEVGQKMSIFTPGYVCKHSVFI